jgi:multisubunit Na+/H+ antiporter MnhE subunit
VIKPEFLAAIVALISAAVSVMSTIYANRLLAKLKRIEVQLQIRREMANKLLECRIEHYPELFERLSNFVKKIDYETLCVEDVKDLLDDVNRWDSRNAIFYTSDTAYTSNNMRKFLAKILKSSGQETGFDLGSEIKNIREKVVEIEIALRSDLGIYGIDFNKDMTDFSGKGLPPLKWW